MPKEKKLVVEFKGDLSENAAGRWKGFCEIQGISMSYSLKPQSRGRYPLRGSMSIIDPQTGVVMAVKGKAVRKDIYVKSTKCEAVRAAISKAAETLYLAHMINLTGRLRNRVLIDETELHLLVQLYGEEFVIQKPQNKDSQIRSLKMLKKVGTCFPIKICEISEQMVRKSKKELGSNWSRYLSMANQFLIYLYQNYKSVREVNPFNRDLLSSGEKKERPGIEQPHFLTKIENIKMDKMILEHIDNGTYIGLTLIKEGGYTAQEVCGLCWNDVSFLKAGGVLIHYRNEIMMGATHDYTAPILQKGGEILGKRFEYLVKSHAKHEVFRMPIASCGDDPTKPLPPQWFTELCRSDPLLKRPAEPAGDGQPTTIGIHLLLKQYEYRLRQHCRLDEAAIKFMRHQRLNSIQADHYRAFVDDTGRHVLLTALDREQHMESPTMLNAGDCVACHPDEMDDQFEWIEVKSQDSRYPAQAWVSLLDMPPGAKIHIRSRNGCRFCAVPKKLNINKK